MSNLRLIAIVCFFCVLEPLSAQYQIEVGGGNYSDDDQSTIIYSGSATYTTKSHMSFTLGYSGKKTNLTSDDVLNPLISQLNPDAVDADDIMVRVNNENSVTGSFDYALNVGTNIGFNAGFGLAGAGSSYWLGANISRWFMQDTLQLTTNLTYTALSQEPFRAADFDRQEIITLANISGVSAGLQFYHLTSPSLILRGGYTLTQRSDRPLAHGLQLEARYFIGGLNAAVHAAGTYYINRGTIGLNTLLGEVDANSLQVQWHQGISNRFVLMAGYRRYLETITPRVQEVNQVKSGTDYIHGSLRWLFTGNKPWTTSGIPELSIFGGHYTANETTDTTTEPNVGIMIGAAFKYPLDAKKKKPKKRHYKKRIRKSSKSGKKRTKTRKYPSKRKKLYKKRR